MAAAVAAAAAAAAAPSGPVFTFENRKCYTIAELGTTNYQFVSGLLLPLRDIETATVTLMPNYMRFRAFDAGFACFHDVGLNPTFGGTGGAGCVAAAGPASKKSRVSSKQNQGDEERSLPEFHAVLEGNVDDSSNCNVRDYYRSYSAVPVDAKILMERLSTRLGSCKNCSFLRIVAYSHEGHGREVDRFLIESHGENSKIEAVIHTLSLEDVETNEIPIRGTIFEATMPFATLFDRIKNIASSCKATQLSVRCPSTDAIVLAAKGEDEPVTATIFGSEATGVFIQPGHDVYEEKLANGRVIRPGYRGQFSASYFMNIARLGGVAKLVHLKMARNFPLVLRVDTAGAGWHTAFIAPRVQDPGDEDYMHGEAQEPR